MRYRHIDSVEVAAVFSPCGTYRYRLDITLPAAGRKGGKTVCAILQNPSVANTEIADKSVQFLEKLVFLKGLAPFCDVERLIIVNQFAFIQTRAFSGMQEHIGPLNDAAIKEAIEEADIILVAWGARNPYEQRKHVIEGFLASCGPKQLLWGKCHPSRARYAEYLAAFPTP